MSQVAVLFFTGLALGVMGLYQRDGMPVFLPYNWVAILFPPVALACFTMGISLMVGGISGR
jgi:hypothetical protein